MKKIPEVGDIITLKEFSFTNKDGGSGMSNWNWGEKYLPPVQVAVVKEWNDYETGQRGWALPRQDDKELMAYLQRNAAEGSYDGNMKWKDEPGVFIIYWSEFDIIDVRETVS